MRPDQIERLVELEESLIDIYLEEADPKNWPGKGAMGDQLTKQQRGDRYWEKKNAIATVALAQETRKLIANDKAALGRDPYNGHELDDKISDAEKRAREAIDRVRAGSTKSEFIKRATGSS